MKSLINRLEYLRKEEIEVLEEIKSIVIRAFMKARNSDEGYPGGLFNINLNGDMEWILLTKRGSEVTEETMVELYLESRNFREFIDKWS